MQPGMGSQGIQLPWVLTVSRVVLLPGQTSSPGCPARWKRSVSTSKSETGSAIRDRKRHQRQEE